MSTPERDEPIAGPERHTEITASTDGPAFSNHGSPSGLRSGAAMSASGELSYNGGFEHDAAPRFQPDEARESGRDAGPEGAVSHDADDDPRRGHP